MTEVIEYPVQALPEPPEEPKPGLKDRWNRLSMRAKVGVAATAAAAVGLAGFGVAETFGGGDGPNKDPRPGSTAESDKPIEFGAELAKKLVNCEPTTFDTEGQGGSGIQSASENTNNGEMTVVADIMVPNMKDCLALEKRAKAAGLDVQGRQVQIASIILDPKNKTLKESQFQQLSDVYGDVKDKFLEPISRGETPDATQTMRVSKSIDPHKVTDLGFGVVNRITVADPSSHESYTATKVTPVTDNEGHAVLHYDAHGSTGTGAENAGGAENIGIPGGYNLLRDGVGVLQPYEAVTENQ